MLITDELCCTVKLTELDYRLVVCMIAFAGTDPGFSSRTGAALKGHPPAKMPLNLIEKKTVSGSKVIFVKYFNKRKQLE